VRIARAKASFWDGCETFLKAKEPPFVFRRVVAPPLLVLLTINVAALVSMSVSLFLYLRTLKGLLVILVKNSG